MNSIETVMKAVKASLETSKKQNSGLSYTIEERLHADPVEMDQSLQSLLETQTQLLHISYKRMCSGAGHDTMVSII